MSQEIVNNHDSGLESRNKINNNFAELYQANSDITIAFSRVYSRSELLSSIGNYIRWDDYDGGVFQLSSDQLSSVDNVFRIERNDGSIIERIWDGVNFYAEWVPLGVQVSNWGVTNPNINGDKLVAGVHMAPPGCTFHLKPYEVYNTDFPIRPSVDINFQGNWATIKRSSQRSSLLTANSNIGTSTVTVADSSVFRIGMRAFVVKIPGVLGGHAMVNGTSVLSGSAGFIITNIVDNVVTLGGSLQQNCVIGDNLVALDSLLLSDSPSAKISINQVIFDGDNINHDDVLDWAAGYGVAVGYGVIESCRFINSPNESLTIGTGSIKNCYAIDCFGSFFHASIAGDGSNAKGILIQNCHCINVVTKNSGHDEGVITFSANSRNVRVKDCVFDNSNGVRGTGVFGLLDSALPSDRDDNFYAENVVAKNFLSVIAVSVTSTAQNFGFIQFVNCEFDTCGYCSIIANDVTNGPYIKRVVFENCEFVNCWIDIRNVRNFIWSNNVYRWDLFSGVYAGSSATFAGLPSTRIGGSALVNGDAACLYATDGINTRGVYIRTSGVWVRDASASDKLPGPSIAAGINIVDCGQVNINGGSITGPGMVANGTFAVGIQYQVAKLKIVESGVTTFAYMQLRISDVDIVNWQCAIGHRVDAWWAVPVPYDTTGWVWSDIDVYTIRDNVFINLVGIDVPSGCVAKNVSVYASDTTTASSSSMIKLNGPIDATKYQGGVAINCYVPICPGSSQAIRLGLTTDNARNKNCIAVGNVVAKAVVLAGSHDSVQDNNTVISIPGMSSPTVTPWRTVGSNQNLY